jgi:Flp pilus assembly protein TadD
LESLQNLDSVLRQGYPDEKGGLHYQLGTILRRLGRVTEANHAFAEAKELSDRFQNTSLQPGESKQ